MAITVTANVTSGTGTTITWTPPSYQVGDYLFLSVEINSTSTTNTLTMTDAGLTAASKISAGMTYAVFNSRTRAANTSYTTTATSSVSAGWRAVAVVVHGINTQSGGWFTVTSDNSSGLGQDHVTDEYLCVIHHARLAASGTSTVSSTGATWTEIVDSYASNLQTAVYVAGPFASTTTPTLTSTWSTSAANTTRHSLSYIRLTQSPYGTSDASLPEMTSDMGGTVTDAAPSGPLSATLPEMASAVDATVEISAALDATLPEMTSSSSGTVKASGSLSGTLPEMTTSVDAVLEIPATLSAALPEMTADHSGGVEFSGSMTADLPEMTASIDGVVLIPSSGTIDASLPEMTASLSGTTELNATVSADLPEMTSSLTAGVEISAALSSTIPAMESSITAEIPQIGGITASLPEMSAEMSGDVRFVGENIAVVRVDVRTYAVELEDRVHTVTHDQDRYGRVYAVKADERIYKVPFEDRMVTVEEV